MSDFRFHLWILLLLRTWASCLSILVLVLSSIYENSHYLKVVGERIDPVKIVVTITEKICGNPLTLCPIHIRYSQVCFIVNIIVNSAVFKEKKHEY